ncbi:MAG: hypothetical protein EA340_15035 [Nitriliruptor sp.]|nr:MAG: hypothetical protein EA340_15035 [Nitriliruptor sp.]
MDEAHHELTISRRWSVDVAGRARVLPAQVHGDVAPGFGQVADTVRAQLARAIARAYGEFATGGRRLGLRPETLAALAAPTVPPPGGRRGLVLHSDIPFTLGRWRCAMRCTGAWAGPGRIPRQCGSTARPSGDPGRRDPSRGR